jgi:YHS domain-containing protein
MISKYLFAVIFSTMTLSAVSQDATVARKAHFNLSDGIAIKGYDPVAYFLRDKAVKGSKNIALYHQGVTYYFASVENKEVFKKNPSKYEPEYGGWCAYAMGAKAEKVSIDPETYKIVNGKLYLFYNKYFNNTLKDWNKDENNLKRTADINWIKIFR